MLAFLGAVPLFSRSAEKKKPEIRPRTRFFKEFNAQTLRACESGHTRLWQSEEFGRVYIKLGKKTYGVPAAADKIVIKNLVTETPGRGHGDAALSMLGSLADKTGVHLLISAEPVAHKAMDYEAIQAWLTKHHYQEMHMPQWLYWRDPNPSPLLPKPESL